MPEDTVRPHHHGKHPEDEAKWVVEIKQALKEDSSFQQKPPSTPSPSIFMAPAPLRGLKHEAFIPQVVPIGPYHCDIGPHHSSFPTNLESARYIAIAATEMEKHKIMASKFVQKSFTDNFTITDLAQKFQGMMDKIKQEYDSEMACSQSEERLALMLALDACFVVEVLKCSAAEAPLKDRKRTKNQIQKQSFDDYYSNRFPLPLRKSILQDFVMLENQIPLFCLIEVMSRMRDVTTKPEKHDAREEAKKTLAQWLLEIAMEVLPFPLDKQEKLGIDKHIGERKHLLDCIYAIVTHAVPHTTKEELVLKPTHFPRATELHHSGISFKPKTRGNMLQVEFDESTKTLSIPMVRVGDDTERIFRNLIAYESHIIDNVHVLSYLRFMNSLVDDADDVALLINKGILEQDIGSDEEVANMWNNLCLNTMRVCSISYETVASQLVHHCGRNLNMWKAELKRTYFSRPWLVLSLFSGLALLVMTILITVYTILLYKKDEK